MTLNITSLIRYIQGQLLEQMGGGGKSDNCPEHTILGDPYIIWKIYYKNVVYYLYKKI